MKSIAVQTSVSDRRGGPFLSGFGPAGLVLAGLALAGSGCSGPDEPPIGQSRLPAATDALGSDAGVLRGVFDREFLFLLPDADSVALVTWFFRSRATSEGVDHRHAVWLDRGGAWEMLSAGSSTAPPTRTPWRLVPTESVGLVVGPADRVRSLVFRDPPRELETEIGTLLTEWIEPGQESIRIYRGATRFPSSTLEGVVLDIVRRWEEDDDIPGDWVFLYGGTDFQLFMDENVPLGEPRAAAAYRGWTRLALRDRRWEAIEVEWTDARPFEPSRRDVPVSWRFESPREELTGELTVSSTRLLAGDGDGPILPVDGLFEVSGLVRADGEEFEVVGFVRHVQH